MMNNRRQSITTHSWVHKGRLGSGLRWKNFLVQPGRPVDLRRDHDPESTAGCKDRTDAEKRLQDNVAALAECQQMLYAQNVHALLVIIQALDAGGKDSLIKHVFSGINPQGCRVTSFKVPSEEELDHDYLWRAVRALPARGMIGVFNRSYYEEVLVVRVHPEFLDRQRLPAEARRAIWANRFDQINQFERYLVENGIHVVKFFLNVSKQEQQERFLKRIDRPEKNWKFATADVTERGHWKQYQRAYEDCLRRTSTAGAPWFVIPADHKWYTRLAVSEILLSKLRSLDLHYPQVSVARRRELQKIRRLLAARD